MNERNKKNEIKGRFPVASFEQTRCLKGSFIDDISEGIIKPPDILLMVKKNYRNLKVVADKQN